METTAQNVIGELMNILILEDDHAKMHAVKSEIKQFNDKIIIDDCENFQDFSQKAQRKKYDLIIVDLLVPLFKDSIDTANVSERIVDIFRDHECANTLTPVLALTKFDSAAEENFKALNLQDITVITFIENDGEWKRILRAKLEICTPFPTYEFLIICALVKESKGFHDAGYIVGDSITIKGLQCREIIIGDKLGAIITAPRMGLVNCAIVTSRAIDLFKPKLVCMSGICAGIESKANIYDIVISQVCQQHDFGKWSSKGYEPEIYNIQIPPKLETKILELLDTETLINAIKNGIILSRSEFPEGTEFFDPRILLAPTSSGSAVIADDKMVEGIKSQHRKMTAFEMEAFAVYEAARLATNPPLYFSAKAVVDDGGKNKGDNFHRVACILSARAVYEIIERGAVFNL
ncbi:phosphorylase family protein [Pseudomonas grimontii]|uniref:phosphorylase family protein n=1 Tax=Pseudomonas grimontii TaxID=129847 RepID=UPI00387B1B8D